jgi:hypothetical protein
MPAAGVRRLRRHRRDDQCGSPTKQGKHEELAGGTQVVKG